MRYEFHLPDIGEGLTEATIAEWFVAIGEPIKEDDLLCSIETDKAIVEITSPCTGVVLELHGAPGDVLKVGTVIARFDAESLGAGAEHSAGDAESRSQAVPAPASPKAEETSPAPSAPIAAPAVNHDVRATPATRRFARERGIDLALVAGSGPDGRILHGDVANFGASPAVQSGAGSDFSPVGQRFAITPIARAEGQTRIPITGLRKAVADQMVRSVTMIPHAASAFRCNAERFVALRKTLQDKLGVRISFTAMVVKAIIPAIAKYPLFNARVDDTTNEIVLSDQVHFGFATHTEEGLIVPVIRNCQDKSLVEISAEIDRLAELARTRKIPLEDIRGGTITLSNVGSHGTAETTGGRLIINHPQAAIIGISRIRPFPVARGDQVAVARCLDINTSYDHRIIDGIYAALFMEKVIDLIEEPGLLFAE